MSSRFLSRMLDAFLDLTVPISNIANPACMNMTRKVDIMIQTVSVSASRIAILSSSAEMAPLNEHAVAAPPADMKGSVQAVHPSVDDVAEAEVAY